MDKCAQIEPFWLQIRHILTYNILNARENSEDDGADYDPTGTRHEMSRHMAEEDDGLDDDADGEMEPEDAEDLADHEDE